MALSLRQAVSAAIADAGPGRHVAVARALCAAAQLDDAPPAANGAGADVELVLVDCLGPTGELPATLRSSAREVWAVIAPAAAGAPFDRALDAPAARRASRVYHPLAMATITPEEGVVLRRLVPGVSARDVAAIFAVRCFAGPDLAPWLPAHGD
jgi:hypothetical protein